MTIEEEITQLKRDAQALADRAYALAEPMWKVRRHLTESGVDTLAALLQFADKVALEGDCFGDDALEYLEENAPFHEYFGEKWEVTA